MNTDKERDPLDDDIDALYAQRKNTIEAPKVKLSGKSVKPKLRMKEMFSILALGGAASFGIFALVNHFAYLPDTSTEQNITSTMYVDTIDVERQGEVQAISLQEENLDKEVGLTLNKPPIRTFELGAEIEVKPQAAKAITLNSNNVAKISLIPNALQHEVVQPTFKVMPSLNRVITSQQRGRVKLAYKISNQGKVENIKVIESSVPRDLEKSARKALSQWRYPQQAATNKELQVEFKFND